MAGSLSSGSGPRCLVRRSALVNPPQRPSRNSTPGGVGRSISDNDPARYGSRSTTGKPRTERRQRVLATSDHGFVSRRDRPICFLPSVAPKRNHGLRFAKSAQEAIRGELAVSRMRLPPPDKRGSRRFAVSMIADRDLPSIIRPAQTSRSSPTRGPQSSRPVRGSQDGRSAAAGAASGHPARCPAWRTRSATSPVRSRGAS